MTKYREDLFDDKGYEIIEIDTRSLRTQRMLSAFLGYVAGFITLVLLQGFYLK